MDHLYVAMTRAKDNQHLVVPQRFFTHCQASRGDRHVYAGRTRFIPPAILGLFACSAWPAAEPWAVTGAASGTVRIDVGARLRGMWR